MAKGKRDFTPIFLKAMERIENEREFASCTAISVYHCDERNPEGEPARLYARIFSPDGKCGNYESRFYRAVQADPDPKALRLTMLALAAACWRDFV